jgi:hypothetical protein
LFFKDKPVTKYIVKHKGIEIKKNVILDTFPSFYLQDYTLYNTNNADERTFDFETKIEPNSILVFSLENCYTEIYEIGKMVFDDKNSRKEKVKQFRKTKQIYR